MFAKRQNTLNSGYKYLVAQNHWKQIQNIYRLLPIFPENSKFYHVLDFFFFFLMPANARVFFNKDG